MNCAAVLALEEGFVTSAERRKRLGQYFSGVGLARLLASLASAQDAKSIIDPMGGTGDMLVGCIAIGALPRTLAAIDIDPAAHQVSTQRLLGAHCIRGSAFDPAVIRRLPLTEWDLVITNPPYVRYQSLTKGAGTDHPLPSATEVREGLEECLNGMTALDETDKRLFKILVKGYSGLADLAVPSWLLAAAMVTKGGRLALVVPESWLSRDYAAVVHYLLFRWFKIEHIVEDGHAVWFGDTQVKTMLVIARRVERRSSAFDWAQDDYFAATWVHGRAVGAGGPIANMPVASEANAELLLGAMAREVAVSGAPTINQFVSITRLSILHHARNALKTCSGQKWFRHMDDGYLSGTGTCFPPVVLDTWSGGNLRRPLVHLETVGVSIGQGLRTGANEFFYATLNRENVNELELISGKLGKNRKVEVPRSCALPVIRRQSELPSGFVITQDQLIGRVLDLHSVALPEDIEAGGELARSSYSPMPDGLAEFVRSAGQVNVGTERDPARIWELSAVSPNVRKGVPKKNSPPRFWYMLPPFKGRHRPDIIIPRVIGDGVKAWLVGEPGIIADANFSTISVMDDGPEAVALIALLNSTWCRVALEYGATVMGGGALKVEATHLRRLPVPEFTPDEWRTLALLGRNFLSSARPEEIDRFIGEVLFGRHPTVPELTALSALSAEGSARRKRSAQDMI